LVTGHGGFLGAAICRQLLAAGYEVRGLSRGDYPELMGLGVESLRGSVTDASDVERALRGVDGVIHTAAIAGVWGSRRVYESVNVGATETLLQGAKRNGVSAFVYTSSPSVTFDGRPQSGISEEVAMPKRWLCDYPRTKAIAERMVLESSDGSQFFACALRPHLIWGVGDPHLIPRVIEKCKGGRLRRVGSGENLIDTVHVENAAYAHVLALQRMLGRDTQASGRAYFITDGEPVGCWEWISTLLRSAGLEEPKGSISLNVAYCLGGILEGVYRVFRIRAEPPMTRFVALQLGVDHYFDITAARRFLGYTPREDRAQRLEELATDLRKSNAD
jgi:2-alkyl-3-oxoalkanoate reductase